MAQDDREFHKRLLKAFHAEAGERLAQYEKAVLGLEALAGRSDDAVEEQRRKVVERLYREVHSLKGAARTVNLSDIERLAQGLESLLHKVRHDPSYQLPRAVFDLFHDVGAVIGVLLAIARGQAVARPDIRPMLMRLEKACQGETLEPAESAEPEPALGEGWNQTSSESPVTASTTSEEAFFPPTAETESPLAAPEPAATPECLPDRTMSDTVRIRVESLDWLMLQVEELLWLKFAWRGQRDGLRNLQDDMDRLRAELPTTEYGLWTDPEQWREHLVSCSEQLDAMATSASGLVESATAMGRELEKELDDLHQQMKDILLLPFSWLLDPMPMMARDLARNQGKRVRVDFSGQEAAIDRRLLEALRDPMIHLLRNAVDHGLESPEERRAANKPEEGRISIRVFQRERNSIQVLIQDDGRGVDRQAVVDAAIKRGMIDVFQASAMSDEEVHQLIFRSGVSTSPLVTELSGRGLGMAIVREKVERVGGDARVESVAGKGATFILNLPVTMTSFRGLAVRAGGRSFVMPVAAVVRVFSLRPEELNQTGGRPTVEIDGREVPVVRLEALLEMEGEAWSEGRRPTLLLNKGGEFLAVAVEALLQEAEMTLKPLGPQLARVRNVAGATVLEGGRLIPVLNTPDLYKSARGETRPVTLREPDRTEGKVVLVAEDSITSRTLLKNILETSGYSVRTTVDGHDALSLLRDEHVDAVVSDIEMPRLDGFGLTEAIRSDPNLADLPVILVTTLEAREHRERGVRVGANAYIVKSSFDQSNLLEVLESLL